MAFHLCNNLLKKVVIVDNIREAIKDTDLVVATSAKGYSVGDVLRQASSPSTNPTGIGGDSNTIWHNDTNTDQVYELDAGVVKVKHPITHLDKGPHPRSRLGFYPKLGL